MLILNGHFKKNKKNWSLLSGLIRSVTVLLDIGLHIFRSIFLTSNVRISQIILKQKFFTKFNRNCNTDSLVCLSLLFSFTSSSLIFNILDGSKMTDHSYQHVEALVIQNAIFMPFQKCSFCLSPQQRSF